MTDESYENAIYEEAKYPCGECGKTVTDPEARGWISDKTKAEHPDWYDFVSKGAMLELCEECLKKHDAST